jgi:hypothetical protein
MAKTTNLFLLISLIILFSGCYTTYNFIPLNIQVLQPALILPPSYNKTAAAFYKNNNVRSDSLNSGFIINAKILFDTLNTDSTASVIYYESMLNSLRQEGYFDTIIDLGKQFTVLENDSLLDILSDSEFDSIKNRYNCGIIYSLHRFEARDISYTRWDMDENRIIIFIDAIWEISSFDNKIKRTLIYHTDTITFDSRYNSIKPEKKILKDRSGLIKEAANEFGAKFALFLVPHWDDVERVYYKSGNIQMKMADTFVKNNEWLKAAEIWKQNTTNKNKNIAAKSMFNLALTCEMEGSYDAAIDWVFKSLEVFGNTNLQHGYNCQDYIRLLSKRISEKEALEKQLATPIQK